jgi:hypothetical protein
MKIYHYTSINSLACILRNKTIRLNALINTDDLEEGNTENYGNFSNLVFVSCWTKNEEENIALWNMYSEKGNGVRIALEEYGLQYIEPIHDYSIKKIDDLSNKKYLVLQYNDGMTTVKYTKNENLLRPIVQDNPEKANGDDVYYRLMDIGRFKRKSWSFQEEIRYILHVYPKQESNTYEDSEIGNTIRFVQEDVGCRRIRKKYLDIPILSEPFNSMEVLMGPNQKKGNLEIIHALKMAYNKKLSIFTSTLQGKVKFK